MATQVQWRGGSTAEHATFTGAAREVTVDTQKQTLVLHDGSTAGGRALLREDGSNAALALGSAGTPSLKFTGDTNTGLYSPGADQVAISTGGSGRLFVDASGNVTVDYSSASAQSNFRVKTNSAGAVANAYFGIDATDYFRIYVTNGETWLRNPQNTPMAFHTNNTERLRITSAGLVGVGTSSPSNTAGFGQQVEIAGTLPCLTLNQNNVGFTTRKYSLAVNGSGDFGIWDNTASTYRMYIDSSGRVGVGIASPGSALHVVNATSRDQLRLGTATTEQYQIGRDTSSGLLWFYGTQTGYTGYVFDGVNGERARIDSSGRLLVGTSSALSATSGPSGSQYSKFVAVGNTLGSSNLIGISSFGYGGVGTGLAANTGIAALNFTDNAAGQFASIVCETDAATGAGDYPGRLVFSTTADGASSPTERMRITNAGRILQGTTTSNGGGGGIECTSINATSNALIVNQTEATAGTTYKLISGYRGVFGVSAVETFIVYNNGNVQNANNSYTAISDIKLKENVADASSQWADLKALRVRNYNLKEGQTHRQIGLIAQEVETISPGLVYETPDRDADGNDLGTTTKAVQYSVLYMKAVKALQEAMERIETLEAKVAALESA